MQCPAGDHDIEAAGIERQVARIGCTDLDALTDAFQPHVAQRRLRAVTRLILTAPDINANHAPRPQTLRGPREHQAMAAAELEYTHTAAPWPPPPPLLHTNEHNRGVSGKQGVI